MLKYLVISLCLIFWSNNSIGQVFLESFDEGDGATAGTDDIGGVAWTAACPTCMGGDYYEILGGVLEGSDTNGEAVWTTSDIDISSCVNFSIEVDLSEVGDMEICSEPCNAGDWIALEYNLDGAGWVSPPAAVFCAGPCTDRDIIQSGDITPDGTVVSFNSGCIPGGTNLQIRITVQTWAGDEAYRIDNVTVNCEDAPSIDAGVDQIICDGSTVTLTAENPDGASISWSPAITDGVAFTPPASTTTTYIVTATIDLCTNTDDVDVTSTTGATATVTPAGPFSGGTGTYFISGSPAGGTWSADCGACIDPATGEFNPDIAGPGTHNICYTVGVPPCDDTECIDVDVVAAGPCGISWSTDFSNPTCYTFTDGSSTINTTGGVMPITYVITDASGTTVNIGGSNTANGLGEGWYYFNVSDDAGCVVIDSVFLDDPDQMTADISVTDPLCNGVPTGLAVADTVENYTGSYDNIGYFWSPNPGGDEGVGADSLENAGGGDYTLIVNDENGCSETFTFSITYPPALFFSEFDYEPAFCRLFGYQSGNGIVFGAAGGGTPDYTYIWTNETTGETSTSTTWGGLNPGDYTMLVTDDNGCTLSQTITVDSLNPIADFTMTSPSFSGSFEGTAVVDVNITNNSLNFANPNNPNADTTFFWNFGIDDNWVLDQDYFTVWDTSYANAGVYDICLVALNKNGCSDTLCVPLTVYDPLFFTPVNIFTPDGDGINDVFTFNDKALSVETFSCIIVNRWGLVVYEMDNIADQWDGNDPSGQICPNGVYFYTYQGAAFNGDLLQGQGTVQLVGKE